VEDLREALLRLPPGDRGRREALRAGGRAVRRLHDAGVLHPDLHVKNLLVPRGGGEALVLDLDGARVLPGGLSREDRAAQILRLDRSLVKMAFRAGARVPATDRRRLVLAYLGEDRPSGEESRRWRRRLRSQIARHRLGWKLGAG
jgi:tRNA A-37 threonylcarbamoyl transferase component Bud32